MEENAKTKRISRRALLLEAAFAAALPLAGCAAGEPLREEKGTVTDNPASDAGRPVRVRLVVGRNLEHEAAVQWEAPGESRLLLRKAGSSSAPGAFSSPDLPVLIEGETFHVHAVRLTGLASGTRYEYRLGGEGEWRSFRTAGDARCRALIFADAQSSDGYRTWGETWRAGTGAMPEADFAACLGDLVDRGADSAHWKDWFAACGDGLPRLPLAPVMGNHEFYRGRKPRETVRPDFFLSAFATPENGLRGLSRWFYDFDCGPVRFFVLNTQWKEAKELGIDLYAEMASWLEKEARACTRPWKAVLMHKDVIRYPKKGDGRQAGFTAAGRRLMPLFDRLGIDLVLSAHLHTYRRRGVIRDFRREGTGPLYIVSGVAGNIRHNRERFSPLDEYAAPLPETDNYLTLEADGRGLTVASFLPDGTRLDLVRIPKWPGQRPVN